MKHGVSRRVVIGGVSIVTIAMVGAVLLLAVRGSGRSAGGGSVDSAGLPTGAISYSYVVSRDEGRLMFPGATVIQKFGNDQQGGVDPSSAFAGSVMSSSALSEDIYTWYAAQLTSRGWGTFQPLRATTQLSTRGWARGARERFIVAMDDPVQISRTVGRIIPASGTVFEARYTIFPSK